MNEQMVKRREQNRRAKRLSQSEVHLCPMSNTIGLPTTPSQKEPTWRIKKAESEWTSKGRCCELNFQGSVGRSSLQILIDKSPVVYEEFIAFGGRRIDLLHDFKKGRVEYSDS
jgi:hypothetical protein